MFCQTSCSSHLSSERLPNTFLSRCVSRRVGHLSHPVLLLLMIEHSLVQSGLVSFWLLSWLGSVYQQVWQGAFLRSCQHFCTLLLLWSNSQIFLPWHLSWRVRLLGHPLSQSRFPEDTIISSWLWLLELLLVLLLQENLHAFLDAGPLHYILLHWSHGAWCERWGPISWLEKRWWATKNVITECQDTFFKPEKIITLTVLLHAGSQ